MLNRQNKMSELEVSVPELWNLLASKKIEMIETSDLAEGMMILFDSILKRCDKGFSLNLIVIF